MSILSTSSKLVRVGDSYSAGEGISIENNTISVTGDYGHAYYPGENISISDDNVISSKDWSSDIDTAVQNASAETTAWVDSQNYLTDAAMSDYALVTDVETTSGILKMDIDTVSGSISGKMDSTAFSDWQNGQYSSDIAGLTNNLDTVSGAVNDLSATVEGLDIPTHQEIIDASGYAYSQSTAWTDSQGYLTAHQDISNLATKNEVNDVSSFLSGAIDYVSANAGDEFPISADEAIQYVQSNSATIDNVNSTVQTNSAQWAEGTSVDTVPVAVISPLVTGFSGESAYLGIESTALNLSSYVPVSAIGVNSQGYVSGISGLNISAYYSRNALTANYAYTADRAYHDRNNNEITSYYQPKLTITGEAGTITSINGSAVGASIPEGWELVAGQGIEIVDDAENNQTTISVTAAGGNPEVESYVQTNSASIDDAVSTYQTNSGSYITQETDWTNTITAASSYAYNEAVAQIPAPFDPTYMSGAIDQNASDIQYISGVAITALPGDLATTGDINDLAQSISETYQVKGDYLTNADSANFYPMTGNPSGFLTSHQDISNKLDTTAFSDVSGSFLTAVNIPESASWNDATTAYQTYSGTYLTAHQPISAEEWNSNYETVTTNSGAWGGSALPISAGPGVKVNLVDNTLVFSNDETVLYSGVGTTAAILAEPITNFESIKVTYYPNEAFYGSASYITEFPSTNTLFTFNVNRFNDTANNAIAYFNALYEVQSDVFTEIQNNHYWINVSSPANISGPGNVQTFISKIVGINRIAGGN